MPNNPFLKLFLIISFFVSIIFFVPFIGSLFLLILPAVLFFNSVFRGTNKTAVAFLAAFSLFLFLAVLLRLDVPAVSVFTVGIAGLFIAQATTRNVSIEKTIIYPALFIIAAISFYFFYEGFIFAMNPWQLVKKYIATLISENVKLYSQLPLKSEDINFIKDNEKNIVQGFTQIFPSLVIISATSCIWMNFLLGKKYLAKAGIIFPGFNALERWKSPDFVIWIFILSGALIFIPYNHLDFFGFNVFLITCFIYLLQGLAIVSFFFQSKNVPHFFRYLFYFLIAVQQILMIAIAIVGLLDIWINFRKYFQKDQTTA